MLNTRFRSVLLATAAAITVTACGADNIASPGVPDFQPAPAPTPTPTPVPTPTPTPPTGGTPPADCPSGTTNAGIITIANGTEVRQCDLSGVITDNVVLTNPGNIIYSLTGQVEVGVDTGATGNAPAGDSAVLTIDPGLVIFGSTQADSLVINRGSQIFANGTATRPIIFTSESNVNGSVTDDNIGEWGGLVILGSAPIAECAGNDPNNPGGTRTDCQQSVEGLSDQRFYGGANPGDSSGSLQFVQVRYPGFALFGGNELNGITLAGVGANTTFENVQVHNSSDDGIEWFGGRVNGKNLALTGNDDDSIDTDVGFRAFLQFVLVVQRAGGGDNGWESDSDGGGQEVLPRQFVQLSNFTFVGNGGSGDDGVEFRGGTDGALFNGTIANFDNCVDIDESQTIRAADAALDDAGPIRFESVFLTCSTAFPDDNTGGNPDTVTSAEILPIFNAGSNNTANGTSTLAAIFINGANETAVPVFDVTAISSFFENVNFIGAVQDANDTRFQGWTCGLYSATGPCTDVSVTLSTS